MRTKDFCLPSSFITIFGIKSYLSHGTSIDDITGGVNFINILLKTFSYESVFCSFSLDTVWICNFLEQKYRRKSCL
jgi:hypothetical protein